MGKAHYNDFVKHMLRFYVKYKDVHDFKYKTEAHKANMLACKVVMAGLSSEDREIVERIFDPAISSDTRFSTLIAEAAEFSGRTDSKVYELVTTVQRDIAKERGLI